MGTQLVNLPSEPDMNSSCWAGTAWCRPKSRMRVAKRNPSKCMRANVRAMAEEAGGESPGLHEAKRRKVGETGCEAGAKAEGRLDRARGKAP